jgi:hypothetical protein
MVKMYKGCAFGAVTREKVEETSRNIEEIKKKLDNLDISINEKMTELFNHQSNRLPMWVTIFFTLGGSLITGLLIWAVTH